jgi:hypothetical protein
MRWGEQRAAGGTGDASSSPPQLRSAVAFGERVRELPLHADDLAAVALERALGARGAKKLPFAQKPPEDFLEGFYWERVSSPARGWCGLRG